ncbi:hypothetical protein GO986_15765 [Deinococcus sp. HMF7620]|uniref:Uncharacterized protein n=1 Tax=Deinococcus arboris TaxID=2682977 RepID=A0A7C9HT94_9DEIO|nr:hypothetical protein [Deinococcus arboris]MVN88207.1 hypothetical protein [Deinococcus arboris]
MSRLPWDTLLLWGSAALLLALVLLPVFTAWRVPALLPWPRAGLAVGAALLAAVVLTVLLTFALGLLGTVAPTWNPYRSAAFEPVDAGLFELFLSAFLALVLTAGGLLWWLRLLVRGTG